MKLEIRDGLPFVEISIESKGRGLTLADVLVDTGSAGSVFSADELAEIGLVYEPEDQVQRVQGVGGAEFVFTKRVDGLAVAEMRVDDFEVEVGSVEYGFDIKGILGMDWLVAVGAVVDLSQLELRSAK